MDLRPPQQEVYASVSSPSELLENPPHKPATTIQVTTNIESLARPKGRPPADVGERLDYYRRKWEAQRNNLRKREERRLRKVGDEDDEEDNASFVIL